MTDLELTNLSTALVVVSTVALFILLAEWSSGTSWGLTSAIVHGVRGWADRDRVGSTPQSPFVEPLAQLLVASGPARYPAIEPPTPAAGVAMGSAAELVELGERHIDGRPAVRVVR